MPKKRVLVSAFLATMMSVGWNGMSVPVVLAAETGIAGTHLELKDTILANLKTTNIGPGVELATFDRLDRRGWVRGQVLKVDLGSKKISTDLLFPGVVSAAEPLSETANKSGAIAGVNGDFFDITGTRAPLGSQVKNGELLKGPVPDWTKVAGVGKDGLGRLADMMLEGTVTLPSGSHPLIALNQSWITYDGIGVFTSAWGSASRKGSVGDAWAVREVLVKDGKVVSISDQAGSGEIPQGSYVILARDSATYAFDGLKAGDPVSVQYKPKANLPEQFQFAVGGNLYLLKDGAVQELDDTSSDPRTAIGFSADGKTMYLATVDGRQQNSRGMTLRELAELLQGLGAANALNLDGGGSTTMVARLPGKNQVEVVNSPSEGSQRPVANGVGIFAAPGSGKLTGITLQPVMDHPDAHRVFPGLSRKLKAAGHDETYAHVVTGALTWQATPTDNASLMADGVFYGKKPGTVTVQAQAQDAKGTVNLQVIGDLFRVKTSAERLSIPTGGSHTFFVTGSDAEGYSAPIEPQDVTLEYDRTILQIAASDNGQFVVTPLVGDGAAVVAVKVKDKQALLPVTIGYKPVVVADFEDESAWGTSGARSTVSVSSDAGQNGQGVKVSFDFTQSTATRTANIHPNATMEAPGQPLQVGVWVKGSGKGEWLSFTLLDASGKYHYVYGPHVTWTGWQFAEAAVPQGVQYPVQIVTIGAIETNKDKQYQGELVYDDLTVKVAPAIRITDQQPANKDPLIVQNGQLEAGRWKFAVLSDSHLTANSADNKQTEQIRTSLRQIVEAKPDFLVISGDLVDASNPENFALAEQLLNEEIGSRFPVYYIPGNHEVMGTGNLDYFLAKFKTNRYSFDHKGTRFILLDSSAGSFGKSDFLQLIDLRSRLNDAAKDPSIKNVVVIGHHPTRDPLPTKNSQLSDGKEAQLVETWLTEFRQSSGGKGAVYVSGHAHTVNVDRVNGVPYLVLGPSGKIPYGPADKGGFYAWNLFGIDGGADWIRTEVRPLLEQVTIEAPASLKAGETATVTAIGHQFGGHKFPLAYPATVAWSGSKNVFIGTGDSLEQARKSGRYNAVLDPETGKLTALKSGTVSISVQSNGITQQATIRIEAK
ncbi:phosphodiester glycosidase family protein [Effusibacillus lacus]|uniref:Metallophosphoesterase n=1 Tax=Effusibacillus lacus TaxID=1348429 RepID=A0A292YJE0_9BACL|nr:phosphodiester glycosidase family protein [Effusibacillus lacus]TCS75559.1 3',5'-cyclic AMP phosphodiesterase CpdA [Effusibacillus lacus]GAX89021.1 hypothetical protein EFBL_0635 [Effusibacillus lacus]